MNELENSPVKDKNDLESIKKFAFPLCQKFLGGCWKNTSFDEFRLTKVSGGLSNYIYKCELIVEDFEPIDDEPKMVLMRLYGELRAEEEILIDTMQTTIIGEHKCGPRVFGYFKEGRLEEYINAASLKHGDFKDPDTNKMIANAVADFHFLKMPSSKEPSFIFDTSEYLFDQSKDITFEDDEKKSKLLNTIRSYNFEKEYEQLKKVIIATDSPVVFCHHDLQMGNILKTYPQLTLIDFEFSAYSFRGLDIGIYFSEQPFNNHTKTYPFFEYKPEDYPAKEKQQEFIQAYIEKVKNIGKKKGLKFHQAMKDLDNDIIEYEANIFALSLLCCTVPWSICQAKESKREFGYLEFAIARADMYFKLKGSLFPKGYESDIFSE